MTRVRRVMVLRAALLVTAWGLSITTPGASYAQGASPEALQDDVGFGAESGGGGNTGSLSLGGGAEARPDVYTIQRGDTLWAISSQFWGDPFFWPKLWSFNPEIGNAHLIYPGNLLQMDAGSYVRPPAVSAGDGQASGSAPVSEQVVDATVVDASVESSGGVCAPEVPFLESRGRVKLRSDGFLREDGFGPLGKVVKAPENKLMFSDRDTVYIQFSRMSEVQCGDRFTIYEPTRKRVYHPIYARRVVGSLYRILAEVEIVDVNEFVATARIQAANGEVRRGALVTEQLERNFDVNIQANNREVEGFIVESLNQESATLGPRDVIYIDRGEEDGVRPGDSFYIVRQGDGIQGRVRKGERDISLPYQIVGKVVVVEPGEYVSQAVITEANQVIEVGDTVTSQVD